MQVLPGPGSLEFIEQNKTHSSRLEALFVGNSKLAENSVQDFFKRLLQLMAILID
jgi:hypothetical protein